MMLWLKHFGALVEHRARACMPAEDIAEPLGSFMKMLCVLLKTTSWNLSKAE